jgi:hypothetical protein
MHCSQLICLVRIVGQFDILHLILVVPDYYPLVQCAKTAYAGISMLSNKLSSSPRSC